MKRYSIFGQITHCVVCNKPKQELHEVYFGNPNRQISIKYGVVIPLCYEHHRGNYGVHGTYGSELDKKLKAEYQIKTMKHYGWTVNDFIKKFGKSYL